MTGTEFQAKMLTDALDYHENGDADDAPCCTAAAPCDTRKWVAARLASLSDEVAQPVATDAAPVAKTAASTSATNTDRVQNPASDAQVAFIAKLVASHDVSKIGTFPARTLAAIQGGKAETVSKTRASSLIDVLKRQPLLADAETSKPSTKQLDYLRSLIVRKGYTIHEDRIAKLSSEDVSVLIDALKVAQDRPAKTAPAQTDKLEDGMYRLDGVIYKVQHAVHGSGRQYAKQLVENGGDWSFEFAPGAIRTLKPEHRLTLDEAKEFGQLYGVCACCGRTLTDEKSIELGIGPVCAGKL